MAKTPKRFESFLAALGANYLHLGLNILINLALIPLLLHGVGEERTGVYMLLFSLANFAFIGIGALVPAGVRLLADAMVGKSTLPPKDVHWVLFLTFAAYSLLFLILSVVSGELLGSWFLIDASPELLTEARNGLVLVGLYVVASFCHCTDTAVLTASLRQTEASLYRVLSQLVFGVGAVCVLYLAPRIDLVLLAQAVGMWTAFIVARVRLLRAGEIYLFRLQIERWRELGRSVLSVGTKFFMYTNLHYLLAYADVFLIGFALGPEAVTQYLLIWKVAEYASLCLGRVSELLTPYLTRLDVAGDHGPLQSLFLLSNRLQLLLAATCGALYALFGQFVVSLWVGEEHVPMGSSLYALAGVCLFFQVSARHAISMHVARAEVVALILPNICEFLLRVALLLLLVASVGIAAPLQSYSISHAALFFVWYALLAARIVGIGPKRWYAEVGAPALYLLVVVSIICYFARDLGFYAAPLVVAGALAVALVNERFASGLSLGEFRVLLRAENSDYGRETEKPLPPTDRATASS